MTNLENVQSNLNTLVDSINALYTNTLSSIADKKTSLLALLDDLRGDYCTLKSLATICGNAGSALLDANEKCDHLGDVVDDVLFGYADIPVGPIDTFVDFCADCGKELHTTDTYTDAGDGYIVCMDCTEAAAKEEAAIEAELDAEEVSENV
jgi:hypothetical protein